MNRLNGLLWLSPSGLRVAYGWEYNILWCTFTSFYSLLCFTVLFLFRSNPFFLDFESVSCLQGLELRPSQATLLSHYHCLIPAMNIDLFAQVVVPIISLFVALPGAVLALLQCCSKRRNTSDRLGKLLTLMALVLWLLTLGA